MNDEMDELLKRIEKSPANFLERALNQLADRYELEPGTDECDAWDIMVACQRICNAEAELAYWRNCGLGL